MTESLFILVRTAADVQENLDEYNSQGWRLVGPVIPVTVSGTVMKWALTFERTTALLSQQINGTLRDDNPRLEGD